jgi:hypothetical protein
VFWEFSAGKVLIERGEGIDARLKYTKNYLYSDDFFAYIYQHRSPMSEVVSA